MFGSFQSFFVTETGFHPIMLKQFNGKEEIELLETIDLQQPTVKR